MSAQSTWLEYTLLAGSANLPDYCEPATPFLEYISSHLHVCIPTTLALVSTVLGTLSIISWLFAQLPQIVRNYRNQSTAGLSFVFLAEWLLGDISNLSGAILTHQATWQIIIGAYYCFVDIALVSQWIWYEKLKHGRPLKRIWLVVGTTKPSTRPDRGDMGPYPGHDKHRNQLHPATSPPAQSRQSSDAQEIPASKTSAAHNMFRTPVYGTISPSASLSSSPANRTIHRFQQQSLPAASPRTVLFLTLLIALASHSATASPTSTPPAPTAHPTPASELIGTALSWSSTLLYLLSRLPQLYLNFRRRSTSGLSPTLFAAAFSGNLFYSSSLLLNPSAWSSMGPHGGRGWAGPDGSDRHHWLAAALPFFLGAAGVLVFDGTVGIQFWLYGDAAARTEEVVFVDEAPVETEGVRRHAHKALRVRRVSGWMRGWLPSAAGEGRISPVRRYRVVEERGEGEALLVDSSGGESDDGGTGGGVRGYGAV